MRNWKRCLIGGIALAAVVVLGSTVAETPARADHEWSWEGVIVGGVIGGLLGPKSDKRSKHRNSFSVGVTLGDPYDGPFFVHRHHGGWHQHPRHRRHGWSVWLGYPGPRHIHPQRYHHREWYGPRLHVRPWQAHPQRHKYRQWHGPRVHLQPWHVHPERHEYRHWRRHQVHPQPRHVHPPQHRHRHVYSQRVHPQPRYVHPQRHRHGHDHRW